MSSLCLPTCPFFLDQFNSLFRITWDIRDNRKIASKHNRNKTSLCFLNAEAHNLKTIFPWAWAQSTCKIWQAQKKTIPTNTYMQTLPVLFLHTFFWVVFMPLAPCFLWTLYFMIQDFYSAFSRPPSFPCSLLTKFKFANRARPKNKQHACFWCFHMHIFCLIYPTC